MKFTLGKKLGMGYAGVLALMVLSSLLVYVKASAIKQSQDQAMTLRVPSMAACKDLQRDLNQTGSKVRQVILAGAESAQREAAKKLFDSAWNDVGRDVSALDAMAAKWSLQESRDQLAEIKKQLPAFREAEESAAKRAAEGDRDAITRAAVELNDHAIAINDAIKKALGGMAESFDKSLQENRERMNEESRSMSETVAVTTLVAVGVGIFVAVFMSREIASATRSVLAQAEAIAAGDLTREDLRVQSQDELGELTVAINKMSTSLKQMILMISENAMRVAGASEELDHTSQEITANSEETAAQAEQVSKAAQTVAQNLHTVATGSEEMGASIKEIAKNATEAARIATSAVQVAETTTATVSKLGDSSKEIGVVIKVITSIAQQTNLLALNATIEAARAGEAGKGFAVVANEVKELAKQTAKATEDISRKVAAIQTDTKAAVDAIGSISGVIHQINAISGTIATAVEEQNATTNEMSRNVTEAAQGSGEITQNITGVAEAAQGTARGAGDTHKASRELVETSAELRRLVERFRINTGSHGEFARREPSATPRGMAASA